jgi:hypothetical protein
MNLTDTITPKSDQLNADDLIAGPITIKVTGVKKYEDGGRKKAAISYEGDNGKPYKPCVSMMRVLVTAWSATGSDYIGRSMTLYRDDSVVYGGIAVGGIRISHLSHIDKDLTMALTVSSTSRKLYTVKVLAVAAKPLPALTPEDAESWAKAVKALAAGTTTTEKIRKHYHLSDQHEEALITAAAEQ